MRPSASIDLSSDSTIWRSLVASRCSSSRPRNGCGFDPAGRRAPRHRSSSRSWSRASSACRAGRRAPPGAASASRGSPRGRSRRRPPRRAPARSPSSPESAASLSWSTVTPRSSISASSRRSGSRCRRARGATLGQRGEHDGRDAQRVPRVLGRAGRRVGLGHELGGIGLRHRLAEVAGDEVGEVFSCEARPDEPARDERVDDEPVEREPDRRSALSCGFASVMIFGASLASHARTARSRRARLSTAGCTDSVARRCRRRSPRRRASRG